MSVNGFLAFCPISSFTRVAPTAARFRIDHAVHALCASHTEFSMYLKLLAVALPLVASGCAGTLPPEVIMSGDDASSPVSVLPQHFSSPVSGYVHRNPVEPKPWRQQNDAQSKQGGAS